MPDRFLTRDNYRVAVWEDMVWSAFDDCAAEVVGLASNEQGRSLVFNGKEEHGRTLVYKIAVALCDSNLYWGIMVGGHKALVFQRVLSADSTRYGLICSEILPVDNFFFVALAMLLVPGDVPLVDVASFGIPPPPRDSQILAANVKQIRQNLDKFPEHADEGGEGGREEEDASGMTVIANSLHLALRFMLPGYEAKTVLVLRRSSSSPVSLHPDPPPLLTLSHTTTASFTGAPTLHLHERPSVGATGFVCKLTFGMQALIIKIVPPGWEGTEDLHQEALVYNALVALQGSVLPRMAGCFEGDGWTVLVLEDCGSAVPDDNLDLLSPQQREMLWQHACSLHASGVQHHDLELRNLMVGDSGDVRIIDYAYAALGHECLGGCSELVNFRVLLGLAAAAA